MSASMSPNKGVDKYRLALKWCFGEELALTNRDFVNCEESQLFWEVCYVNMYIYKYVSLYNMYVGMQWYAYIVYVWQIM